MENSKETNNHESGVVDKEQNEYLIALHKKIRAFGKKLSNIDYIEKRIASGSQVNQEQQQILGKKDTIVKVLSELEALKVQFQKIQPQAPTPREVKKEEKNEVDTTKPLVTLWQVWQFFGDRAFSEARRKGLSTLAPNLEAELNNLLLLAELILDRTGSGSSHVSKLAAQSQEVAVSGVTYKHLYAKLFEIFALLDQVAQVKIVEPPKEVPKAPEVEQKEEQPQVEPKTNGHTEVAESPETKENETDKGDRGRGGRGRGRGGQRRGRGYPYRGNRRGQGQGQGPRPERSQ